MKLWDSLTPCGGFLSEVSVGLVEAFKVAVFFSRLMEVFKNNEAATLYI